MCLAITECGSQGQAEQVEGQALGCRGQDNSYLLLFLLEEEVLDRRSKFSGDQ